MQKINNIYKELSETIILMNNIDACLNPIDRFNSQISKITPNIQKVLANKKLSNEEKVSTIGNLDGIKNAFSQGKLNIKCKKLVYCYPYFDGSKVEKDIKKCEQENSDFCISNKCVKCIDKYGGLVPLYE
jgi:hypothetical protein